MPPIRTERTRINQLTSTYSPDDPPRLPLDFGDLLSILWRMDKHAEEINKVKYYRQCALALGSALGFKSRMLYKLVETTPAGQLYQQLPNVPYRGTNRLLDAQDRKAAIHQLLQVRLDVLRVGTYQDNWGVSWPGSGIMDTDLRERVFAVLFTALQGQYENFGRLLFVVDIVLSDLMLGMGMMDEIELTELIEQHKYPNHADPRTRTAYFAAPPPTTG